MAKTPEAVEKAGYDFGAILQTKRVVLLDGELGSGKTLFCRGLANALSIVDSITSPTFTLINEYHSGRLPFYHVDLYRLNSFDEVAALGLDELINTDAVVAIEWWRKAQRLLSVPCSLISIVINADLSRTIAITDRL